MKNPMHVSIMRTQLPCSASAIAHHQRLQTARSSTQLPLMPTQNHGRCRSRRHPSLSLPFRYRSPRSARSSILTMAALEPQAFLPGGVVHSLATSALVRAVAFSAGVTVVAKYQMDLQKHEAAGGRSWRTTQSMVRLRWAQYVMQTEGYLYAIQTLRNAITANTFLATTVLSLFTLCVGYLWQLINVKFSWYIVAQFGSTAACLLSSAFCFSQSARLMTHAGFMFPIATDSDPEPCSVSGSDEATLTQALVDSSAWRGTREEAEEMVHAACQTSQPPPSSPLVPGITEASACALMVKSEFNQWAGLRYLYLTVPCIAWILCGEVAFLFACFGLVHFLSSVDKPAPSSYKTLWHGNGTMVS